MRPKRASFPNIYEHLIQLNNNNNKRYKAIEKRAEEDMDRWSRGPREYAQTLQMIRERQIKITVRY